MDTQSIAKKYSEHTIVFDDLDLAFEKAKINIRFPISHVVLKNLSKRVAYIFDGIIIAARNDNLYSTFILYRSLLEHFFKGMFLVDKMIATSSDEISENYQKHFFISECLAEQAGVLEMEDLINNNPVKSDFIQFLNTKIPELKGFDKKNQQEISAAIRQFNLKEIIKYLHLRYRQRNILQGSNNIIAQTLPEYSSVSTFTHGGSYASVLMDKFIKQNEIENQLKKILHISLTSTCVTKENFFLTYEIDESFRKYLQILQAIRSFE